MKRLVKARHTDKTCKEKYPPALRGFTLTLNFYSAKSYRFVRKTSNLQLPHPSVIRKWYSSIDGQPGFMAESFNTLEMKAGEAKESGHELVCALMHDEMAIKKHVTENDGMLQSDGTRFHGYFDLGTERDDDDINPSRSSASLIDISRILRKSTSNMTEYALIELRTSDSRMTACCNWILAQMEQSQGNHC